MAVVYLARDKKHDRSVAIKILHPEIVAGMGADRFLLEIRILARLQHPHILALDDSGATAEEPPRPYYAMPDVHGATLRRRLDGEGPLPLTDAMRGLRSTGGPPQYAPSSELFHLDV